MRTPNAECVVCHKPLYRRPRDKARSRYAACVKHRAEAQVLAGITDAQHAGLALGRTGNHRNGRPDSDATKAKKSATSREYWAARPDEAIARGAKTRGPLNRNWRGGVSKLNKSIRTMTENRKWMDAVKARDGRCLRCGATDALEAHHVEGMASIIERFGIVDRDQARACSALWDIGNGETLCVPCHYAEHGRTLCE